jgi:hypothetical protein
MRWYATCADVVRPEIERRFSSESLARHRVTPGTDATGTTAVTTDVGVSRVTRRGELDLMR